MNASIDVQQLQFYTPAMEPLLFLMEPELLCTNDAGQFFLSDIASTVLSDTHELGEEEVCAAAVKAANTLKR